jgi:hypothetical protein
VEAHQSSPDAEVLLYTIVEADFENIGAHPEQQTLQYKLQLDELNRPITNSTHSFTPVSHKVVNLFTTINSTD